MWRNRGNTFAKNEILKPSVGIQFSFLIKQNKQEKKTPNASDFVNNEAGWKQKNWPLPPEAKPADRLFQDCSQSILFGTCTST